MKKRMPVLLGITAVLCIIFVLCVKNPDRPAKPTLVLNEYQLEPYLNIRGWEVTPLACDTIRVPQKFSGRFKDFAEEMQRSGFELDRHKGEEVRCYSFSVDNYGQENVTAQLLLTSENELISAALIEQKPDGFIKSP